ncbi:hypothetical protein Aperf_G00000071786 [Anoplocephala perfoliata]
MVASEFLSYVQSFSATTYVGVEDLADRANFQWNVIVLLVCMLLVTVRQYFMAPLVCYIAVTVSGANSEAYLTNYCWVEGTFPLNLTIGAVPHEHEAWSSKNPEIMNYYQWVPLVLGLQAILYYLPRILWSMFTFNRTGMDLQNLIRTANNAAKEDGEKREKAVRHMAKSLELLLFNRREYRERGGSIARMLQALPGKRHGNNLIYYYLLIKILYVLIGIGQLYLMYAFLRFDQKEGYFFFGYRLLDDLLKGKAWTETQIFPRVGACRPTLYQVSTTNSYFVQCVLPINMLNEKIYVFLYFFLGSVVIIQVLSIPLWIFRISAFRQKHFIKRFLKMADVYDRNSQELRDLIDRFISEFLRQDGHFLLRMLSMNAGDLITVEIVCCLFGNYRKQFYGKDFRGWFVRRERPSEYGNGQKDDYSSYPAGRGNANDFMSTAMLQPGGYATSKQRPLPTAPPRGMPPYPNGGSEFSKVPPLSPPYPNLPEYTTEDGSRVPHPPNAPLAQQQAPPPSPTRNNEYRSTNV